MFKYQARKYREESSGEGGDDSGKTAPSVEELQKQLEDIQSQFGKVKSKNEELLTEAKQAKEAKRKAEAEAAAQAEAKAKADGDHEQLYKSSEAARLALQADHEKLKADIADGKRKVAADKIAHQLADGTNAELLAEFILKRVGYSEDQIKVLDQTGALTVSSLDDLENEFRNDARYAALLKGNQSSGGSATGGSNGSGAANGNKPLTSTQKIAEGLKEL